jgi:hypothetical protein
MVYHQTLSVVLSHQRIKDAANAMGLEVDLIDDLVKSSCMLIIPNLFGAGTSQDWVTVAMVLAGVTTYHKLVRPTLLAELKKRGIGFNTGIEDLAETLLLLSITRNNGFNLESTLVELAAIVVYHAYLRH